MATTNSSLEISLDSTIDSENGAPAKNKKKNDELATDPFVDKVMRTYLKHNWKFTELEDIMDLCNEKRENCDKLPTNKKQILKLFRENRDLVEIFYFVDCDDCDIATQVDHEKSNGVKCRNCKKVLKTIETNFFVSFPIEKQIEKSLKANWSYISKFNTFGNTTSYTDVHDGAILRNILEQYRKSFVNILSLSLNVDGANRFNSNALSVWPIQLLQNYLPPSIRFLPDNIITSGLYYNNVKPNCQKYLLPLVEELTHLKENNIQVTIEDKYLIFKPIITAAIVDLPAKSILQQTKQFGGYDGCTYCENPGQQIVTEKLKKQKKNGKSAGNENSGLVKFVRYLEGDDEYKLRDEIETLERMLAVHTSTDGKSIGGIKGVSCLVGFEHFLIILGMAIDYMHCVLLGAAKRLISFSCTSTYSNRPFYISPKNREILNGKLLAIKPTSSIVRKPRSLDQRKNFKASEYRSLLLYYLPVCLPGCIPNRYVQHIRQLSAAVYTLLKTKIPNQEVDRAEELLIKFVKDHQELYGKENMVMVIHLLKHISQSVRQHGPLWAHSAFAFERNNGCLLKMVNGTTDVLHQMSTKYVLKKSLKTIPHLKKASLKGDNFLGKSVTIVEHGLIVLNVANRKTVNLSNISLDVYKRCKLGNGIFTSLLYTRPKKSIDYFIRLSGGQIGAVKFYSKNGERKYVFMEEYEVIDNIYHIEKVQSTSKVIMAPIELVSEKLIFMQVGLCKYAVAPPNPYEIE